jgi:mannose-6-phosphate isomerase-like protein (cupin superfamily)
MPGMTMPTDPATPFIHVADAIPHLELGKARAGLVATGSQTAGAYGLFRWNMNDEESGPSPHFHKHISEAFYVLDGAIQLYDGRSWTEGRAGDFLHVPPLGVHAFRNRSGSPASMLILFVPGAPREEYFSALGEIAQTGREFTPEERADFLASHDQYEAPEAPTP